MEEVGIKTSIYIRNSYNNYLRIYTDGSKSKQECVGVGIHIPEFKINMSKRLSDQLSVYTAEIVAVIIALQWVEEVRPDRVVICTDSLSVIKSIQSMESAREDLLLELNHSLLRLHRGGIDVQFCWVPAHEGVKGNESADKLAKDALQKEITVPIPLGKGEGKAVIREKGMRIWQKWWEEDTKGRGYYKVQKCVSIKNYKEKTRREEIIISRLRVDHTGLNSTLYLIGKRNSENCEKCGVKENAEHVILHCILYELERRVLQDGVQEAGREWNLIGILGTEGERKGIISTRMALFKFLKVTGLMGRI